MGNGSGGGGRSGTSEDRRAEIGEAAGEAEEALVEPVDLVNPDECETWEDFCRSIFRALSAAPLAALVAFCPIIQEWKYALP